MNEKVEIQEPDEFRARENFCQEYNSHFQLTHFLLGRVCKLSPFVSQKMCFYVYRRKLVKTTEQVDCELALINYCRAIVLYLSDHTFNDNRTAINVEGKGRKGIVQIGLRGQDRQ